jgi:hypothetical protein
MIRKLHIFAEREQKMSSSKMSIFHHHEIIMNNLKLQVLLLPLDTNTFYITISHPLPSPDKHLCLQ